MFAVSYRKFNGLLNIEVHVLKCRALKWIDGSLGGLLRLWFPRVRNCRVVTGLVLRPNS
jgi:hypothetical protein